MADLRYPVGKFALEGPVTDQMRREWRGVLAEAPERFRAAIEGLSAEQLDTPYRPEGWTVRQVIHHVPDSHVNAYVRFRLALTEDNPLIKPYAEAAWAELVDARTGPVEPSLSMLAGLHQRWVALLGSLSDADLARTFQHPERGTVSLDATVGLYAWHCRHHLAHITCLRQRMGW